MTWVRTLELDLPFAGLASDVTHWYSSVHIAAALRRPRGSLRWPMTRKFLQFDEIGYWSEIKLEIVKEYAKAYSRLLSAQRRPALSHVYIDGFAGRGIHVSKRTGDFVRGSPLNALLVDPPFREYFFIDLDDSKG